MADLFKRVMQAVYDERMGAEPKSFLSSFFGARPELVSESDTEIVQIDVIRDSRKIAVDVIRGGQHANVNQAMRFSTKEYKVPLYDERVPLTASMLNKRAPGEDPYQPVNKLARMAAIVADEQVGQARKVLREIERMAASIFQTGAITLKNTESLSFGRKSTHHVTPTTKWAAGTGNPISDIKALCDVIFQDGKRKPRKAIFGSAAWDMFSGNATVKDYLNKLWIKPGEINPAEVVQGATFQGRIWIGDYQLDLYTYNDFYIDATDTLVPYVTTDSVILFDDTADLRKAFGAVELLPEATDDYRRLGMPTIPEFVPGRIVPYTFSELPSTTWAGIQSAPLLIPTAIDTFGDLYNVD
jgi:Phage major capsid protein E.